MDERSMISIIIATKNRKVLLHELLISLVESILKPREVIIVSTGQDIEDVIRRFSHELFIVHKHDKIGGQVRQKKIGLSLVSKNSNWFMFCDDDVKFRKDTLSNIEKICVDSPRSIGGVGLKSVNKQENRVNLLTDLFIKKSFDGKIKKSGVTKNYMNSNVPIYTEWLNGLSVWRKEYLATYNPKLKNYHYASYEDVNFSYLVNKSSQLLYNPNLILLNQQQSAENNFESFRALRENRLEFVLNNSEFSHTALLFYEIACLVKIIWNPKNILKTIFLIKFIYTSFLNKKLTNFRKN